MNADSAIALINTIVFKPDWKLTATNLTDRFEDTINLRVDYPARLANRDQAANGYPVEIWPGANFPIMVGSLDEVGLLRKVFDVLMEVETHENREFFRVMPTYWAPFHPHRHDGIQRWGTPEYDLKFGLA